MALGYAGVALGAFFGFYVRQGLAADQAEVSKHGTSKCPAGQDNAAYMENFRKKFPVPDKPLQYNGITAPERCFEGGQEEHFYILGDYGGITCNDKINGRDPWSYTCGRRDRGANRGRKDVYVKCADNTKDHPERGRHFTPSDATPQYSVADAMRKFAPTSKPRYFLNGGDNFYFGGIDIRCGHPMNDIHNRTAVQFDGVFEKMYSGTDMEAPWFSTLGNHDWGGRKFNAAWDQQIAYTWSTSSSSRWFLPGLYWHQRVNYPTKNFTVDIFMLDTCKGDAKHWTADKGHNVCGGFNDARNTCGDVGGPKNRQSCEGWFKNLFSQQSKWLDEKLGKSDADWQILVSHFPPENFRGWLKPLHIKHGIDLYVGSHRHSQEVHLKSWLGGLNYVIAGGGGGITSENNPGNSGRGLRQYGFMDCAINKTHMVIKSINEHGRIVGTGTITPHEGEGEPTCAHYGCNSTYGDWQACQCTADCWKAGNSWRNKRGRCCRDYKATCPELASCKVLGCGGYDRRKSCQCTPDCDKKGGCCSDYQATCNTPEAQTARANCGAACTIEGKNGNHDCATRVSWQVKHRKSVEEAISMVNEDCKGQCNCSASYYGQSSSSLLQEEEETAVEDAGEEGEEVEENADDQVDVEEVDGKQQSLLEKKITLQEELQNIEQKLSGSSQDVDEAQSIWAEYMNQEEDAEASEE